MVRLRPTSLIRFAFAALIGLALMLNGVGRLAAASDRAAGGNFVVIAGTVITLCQYDSDGGGKDKIHRGHACDQCALRQSPTLPTIDITPTIERRTIVLTLNPAVSPATMAQAAWRPAWPRGPPTV